MTSLVKLAKTTLASAAVVALTAPLAFAQVPIDPSSRNNIGSIADKFGTVPQIIKTIFSLVILAAGTIFVLMFLFGGIQYLTSAGNEEGSTKARKLLVDAIVGLIIVLAAFAVGTYILGLLGFQSDTQSTFGYGVNLVRNIIA